MIQTALIRNAHQDLVSDAAYDMYGLSLATCALDQKIKVWSLDESSGTWSLDDEWKAHDAAITKIDWAHAEFGHIIATSSFDRTVRVWEHVLYSPPQDPAPAPTASAALGNASATTPGPTNGGGAPCRWAEKAVLTEAKGSVRAVQFAPHHFGLKLASISTDNILRIYECLEQPTLSSWQLADEVDVPSLPLSAPSSANHSAHHPGGTAHSRATSTPTQTSVALDGTAATSLTASLLAAQQQQAQGAQGPRPGAGVREADGGWCLAWCKDRYWGEVIAVAAGTSGVVRIIQFSSHRRPHTLLALEPPTASASSGAGGFSSGLATSLGRSSASASRAATNLAASASAPTPATPTAGAGAGGADDDATYAVTSVAWAPSCGRSFHLVATGARDGRVRIWKLRPPPPSSASATGGAAGGLGFGGDEQDNVNNMSVDGSGGGDERWSASLVGEFDDHKTHVGRVEWNVTGTVLASSGNDGRVRLWKQTVGGIWRAAGHVSVEQAEPSASASAAASGGDVDMNENTSTD